MATLSKRKNGNWSIQFFHEGKRRSFYPGKLTAKQARTVLTHVEHLAAARKSGTAPQDSTSQWLASNSDYREKLHRLGICDRPVEPTKTPTLAAFVERYIDSKHDVKASTKTVWKRCQRQMNAFFGDAILLDEVTVAHVKDFRQWLLSAGNQKTPGKGVSENSARKMCSVLGMMFEDAVDRELTPRNPVKHKSIPRNVKPNRTRDYFVTDEQAERILDACPDAQWRLIFTLSRWAGLRCPSETLSVTWDHVQWDRGVLVIPSPKTSHHGNDYREFPIVPKLQRALLDAQEVAQDSSGFLITKYRSSESNLRSQMHKITRRAGYVPWPKTFNNLRASCETELLQDHPNHVVCAWMGHTKTISLTNYAQVRESDFERARAGTLKRTAQCTAEGS